MRLKWIGIILILTLLLAACDRVALPQQTLGSAPPASADPAAEVAVQTPLPALEVPGTSGDTGSLVLVFSDAENKPPKSEATVVILRDSRVLNSGQTASGAYRIVLPVGMYDVLVLTRSTPAGGSLMKDIRIEKDNITTLAAVEPSEVTLTVKFASPNGVPPKKDYTGKLYTNGYEVTGFTARAVDNGVAKILLRRDLVYDLLVDFGEQQLRSEGIQLPEDGLEYPVTLPYEEGLLAVTVQENGGANKAEAQVVILDPAGKTVAAGATYQGLYNISLPAAIDYRVIVQYLNQVQEKTLNLSGDLFAKSQEVFNFTSP